MPGWSFLSVSLKATVLWPVLFCFIFLENVEKACIDVQKSHYSHLCEMISNSDLCLIGGLDQKKKVLTKPLHRGSGCPKKNDLFCSLINQVECSEYMLQGGVFSLCAGTNAVDLAALWNFRGFPRTKMNGSFLGRKKRNGRYFFFFLISPNSFCTFHEKI